MALRYYVSSEEAPFFVNNKMGSSDRIPTSGTYKVGDFIISNTQADGIFGWVCTVAGTPGTWIEIGSGGGSNTKTLSLSSSTVVSSPVREVTIGIKDFNKNTDFLMVYKNSTYLTEGVDYDISSDSTKIVSRTGNWNADSLGDYRFSFVVIKEVEKVNPEAVVGTENIKDSVVTMSKLGEDVKERLDGVDSQLDQMKYYVTPEMFGAVGDCNEGDWVIMPTGTDDTRAIQEAFNYANEKGLMLLFKKKKYLITDTLIFDKPCDIDFNGATIVPFICEYNKPTILCSSQARKEWKNLTISGRGMLQNGIQFTNPDNQAMVIDNIKIYGCRHGVYLNEGECINRAIFNNCDFSSNLIAGIYFKSYETSWSHSAPVHFNKVICNSNGVPKWLLQQNPYYNGVNVLNGVKYGYQVYFRGFTLLNWLDGQISNHGGHNNISFARFDNVNGLRLTGDIEDCSHLVDLNGDELDHDNNDDAELGNIIHFGSVSTSKIDILSPYNLNSTSIVGLRYCAGEHHLTINGDNKSKYHCRVLNSNDVKIYYNGDLSRVNDDCLARVQNITPYKSIRCVDFIKPQVNENNFDNVVADSTNYIIKQFDPSSIDNNNYFNIYNIDDISKIFIKILVESNTYNSDGKVFVSFYTSTGDYISHKLVSTRGINQEGNYFACHSSVDKPSNAIYCKIGFCNQASYEGNVKTHCMNPKRFEVYLIKTEY